MKSTRLLKKGLSGFLVFLSVYTLYAADFPLVTKISVVTIVYDRHGPRLDSISAYLLAQDIERVTATRPSVSTNLKKANGNIILIGNFESPFIRKLTEAKSTIINGLGGKWECFGWLVLDKPTPKINKALIISGSDTRGTAYGVFTLSEKIGVSPWYWWADVPVIKQRELSVDVDDFISDPPSVKYRGIFINDEDWGLQPWAAKTFEPETGDIGPKTYAKVFELLLRLKANLIWPAMHPSTKAFYHYPGNKKVAADYDIIIGSSHAEPMLRNNVGEWDEKSMGDFNYVTNKENVYRYWEERVKESIANDVIYTMGMRGVHDSGMEGVKDPQEAASLLEKIVADQRDLLEKYHHKKSTTIPQAFTAYKEVLDIYDSGLKLPEDVTLVWPDDNYGYIRRLNSEKEQGRSGGSGVYYHASYWGRPHDYLWLSGTHPSLITEEMMKAYETGSRQLWILNVGDIKPLEYNIQLFMDMAFNVTPFTGNGYTKRHMHQWLSDVFGEDRSESITGILWNYYQLAFERRPEFMGWSQTEPTTPTHYTGFNHFYYNDEAQRRIDRYDTLQQQVAGLWKQMDTSHANAFYELVYYPVMGAAWMNKKFLYRDKAYLYAKQNRISAFDYVRLSTMAYDSIVKETDYYNNRLANGKWKYVMSMRPRNLPVYKEPVLPVIALERDDKWSVAPEGYDTMIQKVSTAEMQLPNFISGSHQRYFIDVFLCDTVTVHWTATSADDWIVLSQQNGTLTSSGKEKQVRLWVSVDWSKAPREEQLSSEVTLQGAGKKYIVKVKAFNPLIPRHIKFVENNGYVSLYAQHFDRNSSRASAEWKEVTDLGHTGVSLMATPLSGETPLSSADTVHIIQRSACVSYDFFTLEKSSPLVYVYALPVHPVNDTFHMRCAVSMDDGPVHLLDFMTVGRSEEWKENVLRNYALKKFNFPPLDKGRHTLKIYTVDPGFILDRIVIDLGGRRNAYGVIPESMWNVGVSK